MKVNQVSEHIWSLKIWMLIPVHVWVVADEDGVSLVDAGIQSMAKGILRFIDELQVGPLKRIVLTHGHSDHVGAVEQILKDYPVPVYAHQIEIPYMEGRQPYPRRKKAVPSIAEGITQPLHTDKYGNIQSVGGLTPFFTPGHSPGHVVYFHEKDQVLLAGDLFTSKKGKLNRPMSIFTADMDEAVKSSSIVQQLKPKRLEICHGSPVFQPAEQIDSYIQSYVMTSSR